MNQNIHCVATDDEPIALEILEDYINMVPGLKLVAKCANAMATMKILREHQIDILFIDIKMPGITGVEFIRSLKNPPAVIFTTAFPNYAIDGFDLDVVDYLLKPIPVDRFLKAVNKVFAKYNNAIHNPGSTIQNHPGKNFLFVKSDQRLIKLTYEDILFIEGLENYVRFHCRDKSIVSLSTMKSIEEILPVFPFLRIHRSYIVNLNKVDSVQNNIFSIGNKQLQIGKSYKKSVSEVLKNYYLK
jgi:DNA-binding LytR/AlgR family response regulator